MQWRMRIGCFFASRGKIRGRLREYTMPFTSMIGLRLVLLLMVCIIASADQHDSTPVAQQLDLYTSVMWRGDLADRHGLTLTSDSKWSWIIHSSTTRVRAGDSELNPGPTPAETLAARLRSGTNGNDDINLADVMSEIRHLRNDFTDSSRRIEEKVDRVCNDVEKLTSDCAEVKKELEDLRTENDSLNRRLENIESQSRRNNIILRGLPDERGETWEQCESAVRESLCSDFRMDREWVDNLSIGRAHRLSGRR